jgi:N-acyl-D-aspartate/D-glutamate deacylase
MAMYDILIRGGRIVDGTGAPARPGNVAIQDGVIVAIGDVEGPARETIEANGALVTPGFIDVHTHYDGQFLWDDKLDPSFSNGVTTAIAGNCGVGFAPVRAETKQELMELMEGVEDIPQEVVVQGLKWDWESFPDYLDRLGERRYAIDVAAQVPHSALRTFVMGERGAKHEPATAEDIAEMARLLTEALAAGAIGFSTGRIVEHLSSTGNHVPGTFAEDDELMGLAEAMGKAGRGVFQMNPRGMSGDYVGVPELGRDLRLAEHDKIREIATRSGRPVTYLFLQFHSDEEDWRIFLAESAKANAEGLAIYPQTSSRSVGALSTLGGHHRFELRPSYQAIAHLPLAERIEAMRDPARKAAILAEADDRASAADDANLLQLVDLYTATIRAAYPLSPPLDYEPGPDQTLGALADAAGVSEEEYLYDHLIAHGGRNLVAMFGCNYVDGDLEAVREMLENPAVISGLSDAGAHAKFICDSALPSWQLAFWARDRTRGPMIPVETIVRKLSADNARLYGLDDRGTIAVGKRADINVIDHARLRLELPEMLNDLPAGAPRLIQRATGYLATIVNGTIIRRNDEETGARPGRLVRSSTAGAKVGEKEAAIA